MVDDCSLARTRILPASNAVVTDLEIYRAANQLIQQHGEDAPIEVARLADAMLAKGDLEGQRVWKRVPKAIDVLWARERPEGAALQ